MESIVGIISEYLSICMSDAVYPIGLVISWVIFTCGIHLFVRCNPFLAANYERITFFDCLVHVMVAYLCAVAWIITIPCVVIAFLMMLVPRLISCCTCLVFNVFEALFSRTESPDSDSVPDSKLRREDTPSGNSVSRSNRRREDGPAFHDWDFKRDGEEMKDIWYHGH